MTVKESTGLEAYSMVEDCLLWYPICDIRLVVCRKRRFRVVKHRSEGTGTREDLDDVALQCGPRGYVDMRGTHKWDVPLDEDAQDSVELRWV